MKHLPDYFKNASYTMCGLASALLMVQCILREIGPAGALTVPGFRFVAGLCWFVFFLWAGMLLRQFLLKPRWWVQMLILVAAVLCLYGYYTAQAYLKPAYLYLTIFALGYLAPPKGLDNAGKASGGVEFAFLLVSVFCSVAVTVSEARIGSGTVFGEQYQDMEHLVEWLLNAAEPLLVLLVMYFVANVSFSKESLWMGGKTWFQTLATIAAAFVFLTNLADFHPLFFHRWTCVLRFLAQPISVFLLVVLVRAVLKLIYKERWVDVSWRDIWGL